MPHEHVETHFMATNFVRDVVIGMADGLTVPFALAAGLSGAVQNNKLIVVGGLAEIAAGSIAMGLGGYLAAKFASEHGRRIQKLVLIAPYGLDVPDHPALDIIATPGEELVPMLVSNFDTLKKSLPVKPDMDFVAARYREATTFARLFWEHPTDPKFPRYLHRVKTPTLIVWGEEDKLIPVQHAQVWRKLIPNSEVMIVKGAGHIVHLDKPETIDAIGKFIS